MDIKLLNRTVSTVEAPFKGNPHYSGDICDLFVCTYTEEAKLPDNPTVYDRIIYEDGEIERTGLLKIARERYDNDLVEHEAWILSELYPPTQEEKGFYRFLPKLLDQGDWEGRTINLVSFSDGYISLAEILKAYPEGIDYRDMVWMFKRLLSVLGFVHTMGFIHGAVLPSHVLVHPTEHGAKLIDWCYAQKGPHTIQAAVPAWMDFYAPEIVRRLSEGGPTLANSATDLYMAGKCAIALVGGNPATDEMPDRVPTKVQNFLWRCVRQNQDRRPVEAWDLHDEFDALIEEVVGKRRYRPFTMPKVD